MKTRAQKTTSLAVIGGFALLLTILPTHAPQASATTSAFNAAATYRAKCASCHALDGSGNTAYGKKEKLRDLRSAEVQNQSDAQLLQIIAKGKGKMPGYEKSLGADMCKQLVAYTRSLKK